MSNSVPSNNALVFEAKSFLESQLNSAQPQLSVPCLNYLKSLISSHEESPSSPQPDDKLKEFQLSIAAEIGKLAYWEYSVAEDLFTFNDQFYAIYGTNVEEQKGYRLTPEQYERFFLPASERGIVREVMEKNFDKGNQNSCLNIAHKIRYASGLEGHILVKMHQITDIDGKTIKTFGANQDITEMTRTSRRLERINRLLHSIRTVNKLINAEKDADTLAFKAASTLIKDREFIAAWIALAEPGTQKIRNVVTPNSHSNSMVESKFDAKKRWLNHLEGLTESEFQEETGKVRRVNFNQDGEDLASLCIPLRHGDQFFGFLIVTASQNQINLSEELALTQELANDLAYAFFRLELEKQQDRTTQELTKAKEEAERANKAKDEFLAVMSHEIRTPLNPILGYAQLLQQGQLEGKQQIYLDSIRRAGKQQLTLIDHILTYSRLDRGSIRPRLTQFNLHQTCQDAVLDAQRNSPKHRIHLKQAPGKIPISHDLTVETGESMLLEILHNILANACKYSPPGDIEVYIGYVRKSSELDDFWFYVKDTGVGIEPDLLEQLFTPFTQGDTSYTRYYKGVGLGLAICKKLVSSLGGEIGVESELGVGSEFWFSVPMRITKDSEIKTNSERSATPELEIINGKSILLVDDNDDNNEFTCALLEGYGAKVTIAKNGKEAITSAEGEKFDLILMDLAMPLLNGIEATYCIRGSENPNRETPIVSITADASKEAVVKCDQAGMSGFITKPIAIVTLADTLKEVLA